MGMVLPRYRFVAGEERRFAITGLNKQNKPMPIWVGKESEEMRLLGPSVCNEQRRITQWTIRVHDDGSADILSEDRYENGPPIGPRECSFHGSVYSPTVRRILTRPARRI